MTPALLLLTAWSAQAAAPAPAALVPARGAVDWLVLSVEGRDDDPGGRGGSGGVEWLHEFSPRVLAGAGGYASSISGADWRYLRLSAVVRAGASTLQLGADLGDGRRGGHHFDYRIVRAGLTRALVAGRLYAELGDQYVDVDGSRGHVLKLAASVVPTPAVTLSAAAHLSAGGNLGARYAALRADVRCGRVGLLGGLNLGRARPELFDVFGRRPSTHSSEAFAGATLPLGSQSATFVLDRLRVSGSTRTSVTIAWKIPF